MEPTYQTTNIRHSTSPDKYIWNLVLHLVRTMFLCIYVRVKEVDTLNILNLFHYTNCLKQQIF